MSFQRPPRKPKWPASRFVDDNGHERTDFGFDWHEIIRQEEVTRMLAAPYFDEASALLQGAARVWQGRLGLGHVRAKQLIDISHLLMDRGRKWRSQGLGWSDTGAIKAEGPSGKEVGHLLARFNDERKPWFDEKTLKHPMAARRMVEGAIRLLEEADPLIRATGNRLYADATADKLQDLLEQLGESPSAEPPEPPLSHESYAHLRERAFLRCGEGFCHVMLMIYLHDKSAELSVWSKRHERYRKAAKDAYASFVSDGPEGERLALASAEDTASAYCDINQHYEGEEAKARAGRIMESFLEILRRWIGSDSKRLLPLAPPSADKQLIEP